MTYIKMFFAVTFVVAAQITIASAQSLAEIAKVTAQIEKDPKNPLLASWYLKRGFLYTWNGKFYTIPSVETSKLAADIDINRAKALADAESALKLGENYKAYYLRGLVKSSLRRSDEAEKDFKAAGKLKAEYPIVANVYQVELRAERSSIHTTLNA